MLERIAYGRIANLERTPPMGACFEQDGAVSELIFKAARPKIAQVAVNKGLD
jgi:hypothetical protein